MSNKYPEMKRYGCVRLASTVGYKSRVSLIWGMYGWKESSNILKKAKAVHLDRWVRWYGSDYHNGKLLMSKCTTFDN